MSEATTREKRISKKAGGFTHVSVSHEETEEDRADHDLRVKIITARVNDSRVGPSGWKRTTFAGWIPEWVPSVEDARAYELAKIEGIAVEREFFSFSESDAVDPDEFLKEVMQDQPSWTPFAFYNHYQLPYGSMATIKAWKECTPEPEASE
jgi:hypothetical protein